MDEHDGPSQSQPPPRQPHASASSAVREALGGHGLARPRTTVSAMQPRATAQPLRPGANNVGPAPFVSPRFVPQPQLQQEQQHHVPSNRSGGRGAGLGLERSGWRSPPRHTAVTIEDATPISPPVQPSKSQPVAAGNYPGLRFRVPPLSVDTSPGPHRNQPLAPGSSGVGSNGSGGVDPPPAVVAGRRRTPSGATAASAQVPSGLRSPQRRAAATGARGLTNQRGTAMAAAAPPPSSAILSSVFLRRKPPQPRPSSPSHEPHALQATSSARQVLFFQDTDSETSSQHPRSVDSDPPIQDTRVTSHSTEDSASGTKDDDADGKLNDGGGTCDSTPPVPSPSRSPSKAPFTKELRKRQASHAAHIQLPGIEKLGELSREEEAYDFAILLKPSKFEEHLETHHHNNTTKTSLHRAASDVQSFATSVAAAGNTETPLQQPVNNCITFKLPGTPRSQLRRQRNDPASARAEIIERITRTGLQVKRLLSLDGRQTLLKVKAPQHVLETGAERMKLRKLRKFDQIWMDFSCEVRETFADFDASLGGVRFIDSEKQSIVHSLLTSDATQGILGAGLNEYCPLKTKYVLKMFPLHKHDDLMSLRRHWVTYWRSGYSGSSPATEELTSALSTSCGARTKRLVTHALQQPIDLVAQYYGERVAYYFAWMEMYTRWLIVPSVAGVLLFILQVQSKTLDHPLASTYAICIALWTSLFLIAWKRKAASLAYRWGTLGYEDAEITRPEFYGDDTPLHATDTSGGSSSSVKTYPAWKRYAKYAVTVPIVVTSIVSVMVLTFYAFSVRDQLEAESIAVKAKAQHLAKDIVADLQRGLTLQNFKRLGELGMDWDFWFYFLITPILYGFLIPVLDYGFTKYARRMTNWENHQTETHYQSHLILKVFSFRFVHVFASLYYYAFSSVSTSSSTSTTGNGESLLRVAVQLASFMVTDQLWRNSMQTLYPFVMRRVQVQRKKTATNAQFHQSTVFNGGGGGATGARMRGRHRSRHGSALSHSNGGGGGPAGAGAVSSNAVIHEQCVRLEQASDHAWEEAELETYDTFEDYTEMLIQFGYVTFFSLAFPLAPLLALLNNVLELRMDAFKLCHAKQRPLAQKASGIGIWLYVLQLMSVLAVLTNCLHIAFTTTLLERVYPQITATHKVWVVFCVEHLILMLKVWMLVVIPSTPRDVKDKVRKEREHAKIESARAMAAKIQSQQQPIQQRDQELLVRQQHDHHQELPNTTTTAPQSGDESASSGHVRRRSRATSSSPSDGEGGLREAQAVLEA